MKGAGFRRTQLPARLLPCVLWSLSHTHKNITDCVHRRNLHPRKGHSNKNALLGLEGNIRMAHVALPKAFSGGLQEGSQGKDWEACVAQQVVCMGGERHGQGEDKSTVRAGTPWVVRGRKEIKVEGSNVTNRTWPRNKVTGKNELLLPVSITGCTFVVFSFLLIYMFTCFNFSLEFRVCEFNGSAFSPKL